MLATGCAGPPTASPPPASSAVSNFCDRTHTLTAGQQDTLLRFAAVVRETLSETDAEAVLISRSGLDLSRFDIRYSHAAVAWRGDTGRWTARQLYYACDEERPRIYDQGLAGFAMGTENPSLGYISIVRLPPDAAQALRSTALDNRLALRLLAANYSANAYAFGLQYQNCNQWVMELIATAWGHLGDGEDLRERAQHWLRDSNYTPQPVVVPFALDDGCRGLRAAGAPGRPPARRPGRPAPANQPAGCGGELRARTRPGQSAPRDLPRRPACRGSPGLVADRGRLHAGRRRSGGEPGALTPPPGRPVSPGSRGGLPDLRPLLRLHEEKAAGSPVRPQRNS